MANLARRATSAGAARLFFAAATSPLNLAAFGIGGLIAIGLRSWPMAALGAAAWVALTAWDMVTPGFRRKLQEEVAAEVLELPQADKLLDPASRDAVKHIAISRAERERLSLETPTHLRNFVDLALASVPELERHAVVLVDRLEAHTRYISHGQRRLTDPAHLEQEVQRLDEQAAAATDEQARRQFALARDARKAQLDELGELRQSRERVLANLSRVVATLESLPAKILKMRALDDTAMDSVSGDFGQEIDRINDELRAFEETLRPVEERVR
jgi:hypothetical protein